MTSEVMQFCVEEINVVDEIFYTISFRLFDSMSDFYIPLVHIIILMSVLLMQGSEEQSVIQEDNAESDMEFPVVEPVLADQDLEERMVIRQEFAEVEKGKETIEEELKDNKVVNFLHQSVCVFKLGFI